MELNGRFSYRQIPPTNDARHFLDEVRERVASNTEPGGDVLWLAVDESGAPLTQLSIALRWPLELRREREIERLQSLLADACERIGWHEVDVPVPDGEPDIRIGAVARFADGTPHHVAPSELTADMTAIRTLRVVPEEVEEMVQSSRLLYVRGWNQWELFTLAKREAVLALEAGIRRLVEVETAKKSRKPFSSLLQSLSKVAERPVLSEWELGRADALR